MAAGDARTRDEPGRRCVGPPAVRRPNLHLHPTPSGCLAGGHVPTAACRATVRRTCSARLASADHIIIAMHGGAVMVSDADPAGSALVLLGGLIIIPPLIMEPPAIAIAVQGGTITVLILLLVGSTS